MSRSAKKIKLDHNSRSNNQRDEVHQATLHSGQFMTSTIYDNEVKSEYTTKKFYIFFLQPIDIPCPSPIPNASEPLTSGLPIVSDTAQGETERRTEFNGRYVSLVSLLRVINTFYR